MPNHERYAIELKPALKKLAWSVWASLVVLALLFQFVHGWYFRLPLFPVAVFSLSVATLFVAFAFVHELAHAISFMVFGKATWKDIEYGFNRTAMSFYLHCKVGIPIKAYRAAVLLPVIIGTIPLVWGLATGNMLIYALGMLAFVSGYGDILVLWVLKDAPADLVVKDHPEKLGCLVVL